MYIAYSTIGELFNIQYAIYIYMYLCFILPSFYLLCYIIYMYIIYKVKLVSNIQYAIYVYMLRDEKEGRKKEASKVKQTTRQSNTAHPRQSLFLRKMSCLGWDSNPRHSTL